METEFSEYGLHKQAGNTTLNWHQFPNTLFQIFCSTSLETQSLQYRAAERYLIAFPIATKSLVTLLL